MQSPSPFLWEDFLFLLHNFKQWVLSDISLSPNIYSCALIVNSIVLETLNAKLNPKVTESK